jgi:hypothetical protein
MPGRRRERSPRLTGAGLLPAAVASPRMFRSPKSPCHRPRRPRSAAAASWRRFSGRSWNPVPRHRDFHRLGLGDYRLGPVAVAGIAAVAAGRVVLGISASEVNLPQGRRVTVIEVRRKRDAGSLSSSADMRVPGFRPGERRQRTAGRCGGAGPAPYTGVRYGPGMRLPGPGGFRGWTCIGTKTRD